MTTRRVWLLVSALGLAIGAGTYFTYLLPGGMRQFLIPSHETKRALSDADRAMARESFESMLDPNDKLNSDTAHAYLRVWSYLLLAMGIAFVGMTVKKYATGKSTREPQRAGRESYIWIGLAVATWVFSYYVISLQSGSYANLLGPAWITGPFFLVAYLAVPLAVLVLGSIFEKTDDRLVTKLNALVLMYAYGALCVDWQSPGYLFFDPDLGAFEYIGPLYHALGVAASFLVAYAVTRYAKTKAPVVEAPTIAGQDRRR